MTISLNGKPVNSPVKPDESLHEWMARQGYRLNAPCGGGGRCGKCRVHINNPSQPTANETRLIGDEDLAGGIRLACETAPVDGMAVEFEETVQRPAHIATEGSSVQYDFDPPVTAKAVVLPRPALNDQTADFTRLANALKLDRPAVTRETLRALPETLRQGNWKAVAVLKDSAILGLNPGRVCGVAVDIGTTTLAAYLMDLTSGRQLAVASALNPQKPWGDDVISRCDYARSGGLDDLQRAVAKEIDRMIGQMCGEAGVARTDIYHVTLAGNTVMMHLMAGISPQYIAEAPFIPAFTTAVDFPAVDLGLAVHPGAVTTLLPCVAGYVGADTVAGMVAVGMSVDSEPTLLIDIGTNGEIALAAGGRLLACSTAAGPAFEGAHISSGMGGVDGAINKAVVQDGVRCTTIGNSPARGVCGSGLLDLIAGFLNCGAVDETGRIDPDEAPGWLTVEDGRIVLDKEQDIGITGRDIREVQLAKGAIAAGVDVLVNEAGIRMGDIRRVYLAGGFGSYMDKHSAARVGLIPPELVDRTHAVGNSSGAGAKAVLLSKTAMRQAELLARQTEYVELSARKDFQDLFMDKMFF